MLHGIEGGCNDPDLSRTPCPTCGTVGNFRYHGFYERWIAVASEEGRQEDVCVRVERALCRACRKTHSLLPEDIVPLSNYPKSFREMVDADRRQEPPPPVAETCAKFQIDARTLYRITSACAPPHAACRGTSDETPALTCAHRSPILTVGEAGYSERTGQAEPREEVARMNGEKMAPPEPGGSQAETVFRGGCAALSAAAVKAVLDAASEDARDHAALSLIAATAARPSEVCAAKVGDIARSEDGLSWRIGAVRSRAMGSRMIPVSAQVAEIVDRYLEGRGNLAADDPLFTSRDGRPLSPEALRRIVRRHAESAGERHPDLFDNARVTPMGLRRSVIIQMLMRGVDPAIVSRFIGCGHHPHVASCYLGEERAEALISDRIRAFLDSQEASS